MDSPNPDPSSHPPNVLHYNIFWTERTFSSRAATDALLGPQRDAGVLTASDYENASKFFPGIHRYYDVTGMTAGAGLAYSCRRPQWTRPRTGAFVLFGAITGHIIGRIWKFKAHMSFVKSIENPAGFSQAMDNIQKNVGAPNRPGPVIERTFEGSLVQDGDNGQENAFAGAQDTTVPQPQPVIRTTPTPPSQSSRWEAIRAANARSAPTSSWDSLRQRHERAKMPPQTGDNNNSTFLSQESTKDRAAEQAEFDALLERERNIKE